MFNATCRRGEQVPANCAFEMHHVPREGRAQDEPLGLCNQGRRHELCNEPGNHLSPVRQVRCFEGRGADGDAHDHDAVRAVLHVDSGGELSALRRDAPVHGAFRGPDAQADRADPLGADAAEALEGGTQNRGLAYDADVVVVGNCRCVGDCCGRCAEGLVQRQGEEQTRLDVALLGPPLRLDGRARRCTQNV